MSKGSKRRPELVKGAAESNWERIFGKRKKLKRLCELCHRDTAKDDAWFYSTYKGAVCAEGYGCGGLTPDEMLWNWYPRWRLKFGAETKDRLALDPPTR